MGQRRRRFIGMHPGDTLDGYTILRLIGRGGYGEVWLCRSDAVGDYRALKFVPAGAPHLLDREFEALIRYRKAAARLRSPHLMLIEHAGRNAEGLYYIMPLADGTGDDPTDPAWRPLSLALLIEQRAASATWYTCEEIAAWAGPVLQALQTLSDSGFVHRDVKPENILLFGGQTSLADISLLDEDLDSITLRGTPGYRTPSWYVGGHPDMYGAAATLYTLLTGNQPDRMGRSAFLGPPQGEASLSEGERARRKQLHAVIRRATEEQVAERYRDFREMAAALSGLPRGPAPGKPFRFLLAGVLVLAMAAAIPILKLPGKNWAGDKPSPVLAGIAPGVKADRGGQVSGPELATEETPFVNSLGMKFVPVPGTEVLFCIHETRHRDYAQYAESNAGIGDWWQEQTFDGFPLRERPEDHPVVNLTWEECVAFCEWLSAIEQKSYRLPTDREWNIAVGLEERSGEEPEGVIKKTSQEFPWGPAWPPPPGSGNYSDQSRKAKAPQPQYRYLELYDDGFPTTAPVMSFAPNRFGLYDLGGNVWESVEDWYDDTKSYHVLRGGSWDNDDRIALASSSRCRHRPLRHSRLGFRVVLARSGAR